MMPWFTGIAILCLISCLAAGVYGVRRKYVKHKNLTTANIAIIVITAVLTCSFGGSAALMSLSLDAAISTVNSDNISWTLAHEDVEVRMSGFGTDSQIYGFLRNGFGDQYDTVMRSCTDGEFLAVDDGVNNDQQKIEANQKYLRDIGYEDATGFRNAVCYPSTVIDAETYKRLDSMTEDELKTLYEKFRWQEVYRRNLTSLRFLDMSLQMMETFDDFQQQNDMWAPILREMIDRAKSDPEYLETLYVTEPDGAKHLCAEVQRYAGMLCMSMDNGVITGVRPIKTIVNWHLPSISGEPQTRWTVMLDEPQDQEEWPSVILDFFNEKSGENAHRGGFNVADIRALRASLEDPQPAEQPVESAPEPYTPPATTIPEPDPVPVTPTERGITAYYKEYGNESNEIHSPKTYKFTVGGEFSVKHLPLDGWVYKTSKGATSGKKMPDENFSVTFYYERKPDTSLVELRVEHRDVDTDGLLASNNYNVTKGSTHTLSADYNGEHYVYLNNSEGSTLSKINVTVNSKKTVVFYYYRERLVKTKYVDWDTKEEIQSWTPSYWRQGSTYKVTARLNVPGYEFYKNSQGGTSTTVTGTTPANDDTVVTFYYRAVAGEYEVLTLHRNLNTGETIDTDSEKVQAGKPYETHIRSFPDFNYSHRTGDPASGTMPNHQVVVTYWYTPKSPGGPGVPEIPDIPTDGDGDKNGNAMPGNNGTGNAAEGIGPGRHEEDNYIPQEVNDTKGQQGNESTANHRPSDNSGGQAAGSDDRQQVSSDPVEATVSNIQNTPSSGNGGQDHTVTVTGADEVRGSDPASKDVPAQSNQVTSTTTNQTTTSSGGTVTSTTTVDVSNTHHSEALDWEP